MKKIIAIIMMALIMPTFAQAKGGGGGGGRSSGGGARSSVSSSRTATSTPTRSTSTVSKPSVSKSPTSSTKTVSSPTNKTVAGKSFGKKGYTVGDGYNPSFRGGYVAPQGSTVYYRESSMMDWLPFYMIMNSQNAHREAVVTTPDGKEEVVKEEGLDGMYIFNWIISILLIFGIIGGIVYLVNKKTNKYNYV
jgi:hypothetical protein